MRQILNVCSMEYTANLQLSFGEYVSTLLIHIHVYLPEHKSVSKPVCVHMCRSVFDGQIQSTLPLLNLHKSNNQLSRRSIQVLFSIFYIVFNPQKSKLCIQSQWIRL